MSKLDDFAKYIREQLSGYIGEPNSEDSKERMAKELVEIIDSAAKKFDDTWVEGLPKVGDFVEARSVDSGLLEPDDMSKPLYDSAQGSISLVYMMPGTPLLVLATDGRDRGNTRVMSIWSGDVGWMHMDCLRPFEL
jgi:hypothetical protein